MLLWLCFHDAIPTASFRYKRGLSTTDVCLRCASDVESVIHCFLFCPKAMQIVALCPPTNFVKVNCDDSFLINGFLAGFGCIIRDSEGVGYRLALVGFKQLPVYIINFIQRSANTIADFLARGATSSKQAYKELRRHFGFA
ncbi:hypothetical protein PIB30_004268 [Stylosanthes scabra]|uniref:Reverse transcriptase zinc-binding domain-containing protein n=1 Tax=Stylosanthes scabra TaxID=79078 RepID=A0ABU6T3C7_9FABA|nr:hypothetical protein [Stylosanthes scabra]